MELLTNGLLRQQSRFRVTSLVSKEKNRDVSLNNARMCGSTADVLLAARDWLFFSQSRST